MIKFYEDTHTYFNSKNEMIPSVSKLIQFEHPEMYKNIPTQILKNKASYGTKVHKAIEDIENGMIEKKKLMMSRNTDPNIKIAVDQYFKLKKQYKFEVKNMEQIISYEERYAGTYDLLTDKDFIMDIKTTQELHKDYLALQLGLYYLGLGIEKEYGYCIWLPKASKGELIDIKVWNKEQCLDLLGRYENAQVNQSEINYDFY